MRRNCFVMVNNGWMDSAPDPKIALQVLGQAVLPTATLTSLGPRERNELGVATARMPARANKGHGKAMARKYLWGAQEPFLNVQAVLPTAQNMSRLYFLRQLRHH